MYGLHWVHRNGVVVIGVVICAVLHTEYMQCLHGMSAANLWNISNQLHGNGWVERQVAGQIVVRWFLLLL